MNVSTGIEDAIRNARAASEEGLVAGGGVALIQAASKALGSLNFSGDEATGVNTFARPSPHRSSRSLRTLVKVALLLLTALLRWSPASV